MKIIYIFILTLFCLLFSACAMTGAQYTTTANAAFYGMDIYASPDGDEYNDGTINHPLDLKSAIQFISSDHNIYLLEGNYNINSELKVYNDNKYILIEPYQDGKVTLDFSSQVDYESGIRLIGNYIHLKNLEIKNSSGVGILINGDYNIIENCEVHHNNGNGIEISDYLYDREDYIIDQNNWPKNNLVLNTTSYQNRDTLTNFSASGFAAIYTVGENNVFDGCIAYNNVGCGFNLDTKAKYGAISPVLIINSIAFKNGLDQDNNYISNSIGNGFKLGGNSIAVSHYIENCMAFMNAGHGFSSSTNTGVITVLDCTAYNNNESNNGKSNFHMNNINSDNHFFSSIISFYTERDGIIIESDKLIGTAIHTIYYNSSKWYLVDLQQAINSREASLRGRELLLSEIPSSSDFVSLSLDDFISPHELRDFDNKIDLNGFLNAQGIYLTLCIDAFITGASY